MTDEVVILVAEDNDGHAALIQKNLRRAGLRNSILVFGDGQAILDFLFLRGDGPRRDSGRPYLLLLDIRMPKVDGIEVLRRIKADPELRKLPVTMLTTTEDPREVGRCHALGCSNYVTKPVDYDKFIEAIRQLGLFFTVVQVPSINGAI
ncbi:MAG: response regulator [Chloroflexales bacterium]|nr:response regulator [Chloroflexales bacterium]